MTYIAAHGKFGMSRFMIHSGAGDLAAKRAILLRVPGRLCERFCAPCCCTGCCNELTLKCQDGRTGGWSLVALASGLPLARK